MTYTGVQSSTPLYGYYNIFHDWGSTYGGIAHLYFLWRDTRNNYIATIIDGIYYTTYGSISTRELINYGMLWEGVALCGIYNMGCNSNLAWYDWYLATKIYGGLI